jgi:hypothetical protein
VDDVRGLDSRLCVELGRVRDFEQHVLHHVGTIRALELERPALEENVVEAPRLGGQHGRQTGLAPLDEVGQVDSARASVASGPRLTRACVRRVAVGTERLAIHPCLRDGVDGLVARKAAGNKDVSSLVARFGSIKTWEWKKPYVQKLRYDSSGRDLDEDDVVEADAVERVQQCKTALDLVRFDHALEDVFDGDMLALACKVVRDSKNGSEIVGRVAPWNGVIQFRDVARAGGGQQR